MSKHKKYQKKRLRTTYISVVVSISLVLFLVGVLGVILLNTRDLSNYVKEKVVVTIFLKDSANEKDKELFAKSLKEKPYTKKTVFITKDEAAKTYSKEIGEDFVAFLGTNPLKDAIDLSLNSAYVSTEATKKVVAELEQEKAVYEVVYDQSIIKFLTHNIKRVSLWLLIFGGIFTLISVILINNSIRLSIYAKRFDIKTMQLVGATKRFIRRPFILKSVQLGIIGALVALIAISLLLLYIQQHFPSINLFSNYIELGILAGFIVLLGIFISWISTFLATQKLLGVRTEELY
ncbi:MAG: permease-like cell division protein FtsX [Flavobacteriaceae bacterium]|nr:permease-like cell division protein FtsX [Flavobacteriaceae bacterium]